MYQEPAGIHGSSNFTLVLIPFQGINTKASGTYFSVKLPHESLLFIDMPKEQRKKLRKRLEKSDTKLGREDYKLTLEEMHQNNFPLPSAVSGDDIGEGEHNGISDECA